MHRILFYGAGGRFHELIGATMLSFYDWYADLPPASKLRVAEKLHGN